MYVVNNNNLGYLGQNEAIALRNRLANKAAAEAAAIRKMEKLKILQDTLRLKRAQASALAQAKIAAETERIRLKQEAAVAKARIQPEQKTARLIAQQAGKTARVTVQQEQQTARVTAKQTAATEQARVAAGTSTPAYSEVSPLISQPATQAAVGAGTPASYSSGDYSTASGEGIPGTTAETGVEEAGMFGMSSQTIMILAGVGLVMYMLSSKKSKKRRR